MFMFLCKLSRYVIIIIISNVIDKITLIEFVIFFWGGRGEGFFVFSFFGFRFSFFVFRFSFISSFLRFFLMR